MSQIKPRAPVKRKAHCQPIFSAINGTQRGAAIAPILAPELKIPVAKALSFLGNHSATVLMAAGKLPASLIPKAALATPKPKVPFTKACPIAERLHNNID